MRPQKPSTSVLSRRAQQVRTIGSVIVLAVLLTSSLAAVTPSIAAAGASAGPTPSSGGPPVGVATATSPPVAPIPSWTLPTLGGPTPAGPTVCAHPTATPFAGQIVVGVDRSVTPAGAPASWSGTTLVLTGPVDGSVLDLAQNVTVDGSGCSLTYAASPVGDYGNSTAIEVRLAANVTVENFPITANGSTGTGALVNGSASVTVYNVSAPLEEVGLEAANSTNVNLTGSSVDAALAVGVEFVNTVNGLAWNDTANGSVLGFEAQGTQGIDFVGNVASGTQTGALLANDSSSWVESNTFAGANTTAIELLNSAGDNLSENWASALSIGSGSGITIGNTTGGVGLYGNTLTGGWSDAVDVEGTVQGPLSVVGNVLANTTYDGVYVGGEVTGTLTVSGNDLTTNGTNGPWGVELYEVDGAVVIYANNMTGGVGDGISADGGGRLGGDLLIDGNQIANATASAVLLDGFIYGTISIIDNDLSANATTSQNGATGVYLSEDLALTGSMSMVGNNLTGGLSVGLDVETSALQSLELRANNFANATDGGVLLDAGLYGNLTVVGNDFAANASTASGPGVTAGVQGLDIEEYFVEGTTYVAENNFSGGLSYGVDYDPWVPFYEGGPPSYGWALPGKGGSVTVVGNDLSNVAAYGIWLLYVPGNLVVNGNDFAANATYAGYATGIFVSWKTIDIAEFGFYWIGPPIEGSTTILDNDFSGLYYGVWAYPLPSDFYGDYGFAGSVTIGSNNFANETGLGDGAAIVLAGVGGDLTVVSNDFSANSSTLGTGYALYAIGVNGAATIDANNMSGGEYQGIGLYEVAGPVTIVGNDISNALNDSIGLGEVQSVLIEDNNLSTSSPYPGLDDANINITGGAGAVTIEGNDLRGVPGSDAWIGVWVESAASVDVVDNTITAPSFNAIDILNTGQVVVASNDIADAGNTGIRISSATSASVTGNLVSGSGYGIVIDSTENVIVSSNDASGTTGYALALYGESPTGNIATVANNNLSASGGVDIVTAGLVFVGNDLLGSGNLLFSDDALYAFDLNDLNSSAHALFSGTTIVGGTFNAPLPIGGNYWSGCTISSSRDGIGSTPCAVPGTSFFDALPLTGPWFGAAVTFTESGLPRGTTWGVSVPGLGVLSATAPGAIVFYPGNGEFTSYAFTVSAPTGYTADPASGTVDWTRAAIDVSVTFTVATVPVSFSEQNLSAGTLWSVDLNGVSHTAAAPASITFDVPNGTYAFTVGLPDGLEAPITPSSGTVVVRGSAVSLAISFPPAPVPLPSRYAVGISVAGIAPSAVWSLELEATAASSGPGAPIFVNSTGPALASIELENGSYLYEFHAVGYSAQDGSLVVRGAPTTLSIPVADTLSSALAVPGDSLALGVVILATLVGAALATLGAVLLFRIPRDRAARSPSPPRHRPQDRVGGEEF